MDCWPPVTSSAVTQHWEFLFLWWTWIYKIFALARLLGCLHEAVLCILLLLCFVWNIQHCFLFKFVSAAWIDGSYCDQKHLCLWAHFIVNVIFECTGRQKRWKITEFLSLLWVLCWMRGCTKMKLMQKVVEEHNSSLLCAEMCMFKLMFRLSLTEWTEKGHALWFRCRRVLRTVFNAAFVHIGLSSLAV